MDGRKLLVENGTVYTPDRVIADGVVLVEGSVISYIGTREGLGPKENLDRLDAQGARICPGFIDLHLNGGGGRDVLEGTPDAMEGIARGHARFGTTGMLIAVPGIDDDRVSKCLRSVAETSRRKTAGARVLGTHMEGPFISPAQRGVIPGDWLLAPSDDKLSYYLDQSEGTLRIMTLAPELDGARDLIHGVRDKGVVPSMGHTDATYVQAMAGIDAGIRYGSHVFNAMRAFTHKDPGAPGAALLSPRVMTEVVADGFHVHPAAVALLWRCKSRDGVVLVTDAVEVVGTNETEFQIAGTRVHVKGGRTWRDDGGGLAGSVLTLNTALANLCQWLSLPLEDVLPAASINPARVLGIADRKGSLNVGKDADVVIMTADFEVLSTVVEGQIVYQATV